MSKLAKMKIQQDNTKATIRGEWGNGDTPCFRQTTVFKVVLHSAVDVATRKYIS